jgi:hypothetical protein
MTYQQDGDGGTFERTAYRLKGVVAEKIPLAVTSRTSVVNGLLDACRPRP